MRFWLALVVALTFFSTNVVPEYSYAKTQEKSQKSKKSKKAKSKKNTKKKANAAKKKSSRSAKKNRRGRSGATAPAYAPLYSEFLVDGETGRILHQEDANERRYPASLTKLMTIYLTFEQLKAGHMRMNEDLRVSAYAASMPKTNLALSPGDDLTVKEALLGLIIHSANDAAVVLAENISGDEDRFARLMTERAHQLGMKNTYFKNACGLHNPGQVTTAKDMALLAIALKKHYPEYYDMFTRSSFVYNGREYNSHNRVTTGYRGAEGLKTGYVRASGFNLVTSATRYEGNLVGVVIGGRTAAGRDQRMRDLLDAGFEKLASLKKKDNFASPRAENGTLSMASLEPASGKVIKFTENAEEAQGDEMLSPQAKEEKLNNQGDEKLALTAVENKKTAKHAGASTKGKQAKTTQAKQPATSADIKHFNDNFVPKPKGKPRKIAS